MAEPPSYEESASVYGSGFGEKADSKSTQHFSIREEVGASRSQHVAALVAKLLPQVRERAKAGLSKSHLLLLPADQDCSRKGQLVVAPDDEQPILIQLEGRHDNLEFWSQKEALEILKAQLLAAISDSVTSSAPIPEAITRAASDAPSARTLMVEAKTSFFGRKQSKAAAAKPATRPVGQPVTVEVLLDEVHFRTETEYGLYETLRGRAVSVTVEVR